MLDFFHINCLIFNYFLNNRRNSLIFQNFSGKHFIFNNNFANHFINKNGSLPGIFSNF